MSLKEFVKIAPGLREHPKVLKAGDDGGWLFVCAIMWSKEHDTDGFIPDYAVPRLTGLKQPRKVMDRCVAAGLFEATDGGWMIHDYLEVQESSAARKAAGRKAAEIRWERERNAKSMRIASESHAGRTADAVRNRITEKEEEKEEEPPRPPQGGRARERVEYEGELAEFTARHFPGIDPGYVAHFAGELRARNAAPTVDALRPLLGEFVNGGRAA